MHKIDGRITLTAGSLLDNLHWHYVTIKRYGRQVNFTVDSQTVTAVCNGEFTHLDLDTQVLHKGAICVYNNNIMMSCMLNTFIQCFFICKLLYIKSQLYELILILQSYFLHLFTLMTMTECLNYLSNSYM